MTTPSITVVAAGINLRETLAGWLQALAPQVARHEAEVLLAVTEADRLAASFVRSLGFVELVLVPSARLVPNLWGAVMGRARGRVIAVTTTACEPASDWLDAVAAAHERPHAAIGGTIEFGRGATLVDRAVHLVRYAPYLPPIAGGPVAEIAADNGTYKREALEPLLPSIARDGFWEVEVHRALRASGATLWLDPRLRVGHASSYSAGAFSKQRFLHGRRFGRTRPEARAAPARWLRVASAPAVPILMFGRMVRRLRRGRRLDVRTALALPLSAWFLTCWAAGEAVGYLDD